MRPQTAQETRRLCETLVRGGLVLGLLVSMACGEGQLRRRPPFLAVSTDVVDFGRVQVGETRERTVYLINKGDSSLNLQEPEGNTLGGVFSILLNAREIAALDDVVARVIFSPSRAAAYETSFLLENDSDNAPDIQVDVVGTAVEGEPCAGTTCHNPPAAACLDADTSRYSPPFGECVDGTCEYDWVDQDCDFGCDFSTGLCNGDPCQGVACQTPPSSCFSANGQCQDGACLYTTINGVGCNDEDPCTANDTCREGVCVGSPRSCTSPPADSCVSGTVLRRWEPQGYCDENGSCRYTPSDVNCPHGCTNGACQGDPCAGGCDDGNPCTIDSCDPISGCAHDSNDGASCTSPSAECPVGRCSGAQCLSVSGLTCQTEVSVDLCAEVEVAGVCAASGDCVVEEVPPQFICPGCAGICLQCYGIQLCIDLTSL